MNSFQQEVRSRVGTHCLHPSPGPVPVCRLLLLAFAIAALLLDDALGGLVGVSTFSLIGVFAFEFDDAAAAMPSLLCGRLTTFAVLVRGNLLFVAAEAEVKLVAPPEPVEEVVRPPPEEDVLTPREFQLPPCEPALLSRLTGRW